MITKESISECGGICYSLMATSSIKSKNVEVVVKNKQLVKYYSLDNKITIKIEFIKENA